MARVPPPPPAEESMASAMFTPPPEVPARDAYGPTDVPIGDPVAVEPRAYGMSGNYPPVILALARLLRSLQQQQPPPPPQVARGPQSFQGSAPTREG